MPVTNNNDSMVTGLAARTQLVRSRKIVFEADEKVRMRCIAGFEGE
jgi:hypothetical protein